MRKIIISICVLLFVASATYAQYKDDILGNGYQSRTIQLADDYEGKVIATLIKKESKIKSNKAVLYIHGFCDYFFNKELGNAISNAGYNFYAIDLRKYGRSLLDNQTPNRCRSITEYFADIDSAISIIQSEGNKTIHLIAHSTGGLITSLYAASKGNKPNFNSLALNSPFFDFNESTLNESILIPIVTSIGSFKPEMKLPNGLSSLYGETISKNHKGEWEFNEKWKPVIAFRMDAGWLRAIHQGHNKIKRGIDIQCPVIVYSSDKSIREKTWSENYRYADGVLDVNDIRTRATRIGKDVRYLVIPSAMHDISLSTKIVREKYLEELIKWFNVN